jgi:hypothetical protein
MRRSSMASWWLWGRMASPASTCFRTSVQPSRTIIYYAFDILFRKGEDLTQLPLSKRREVLESVVKPSDHVGLSQVADKTSPQMLRFVRAHGLDLRTALRFRHSFRYESEMASFCAPLRRRSSLPQTYVSRRGTHADNGVGNSAPIVYRRVPNALRPG